MKITKTQLKQIIKEEFKATLNEDDQMAKAQELAQVFAQSPEIMAVVQRAAQEPEAQAAMTDNLTEYDKTDVALWALPFAPSAALLAFLAVHAPILALGMTGGLALTAIGLLVGAEARKKDSLEDARAHNAKIRARSYRK
jgi:hypothetical protein